MAVRDDRRLVKLVRDDVEKFCGGDMGVRYEVMPEAEYLAELRKKLVEEAAEYLVDPCVEELADVWEAVLALADASHDGIAAVQIAAEDKHRHKGGFETRLGMYLFVAEEHRR